MKYMQHKQCGYKWTFYAGSRYDMTIPGSSFMDDTLLLADNPVEIQTMIQEFNQFLHYTGMALNPSKCTYSAINTPDQPLISINNTEIPFTPSHIPITYLGYYIPLTNSRPSLDWQIHNQNLHNKIQEACNRFTNSIFRTPEVS